MEMQDLLWKRTNHTHENPQYSQPNSCEIVGDQVTPELQGSRNHGKESCSNGKLSQVKTALFICLILTIVCVFATIVLFTKVRNNEKMLEKSLNQLKKLSIYYKNTSFEEKAERSFKQVRPRLNQIKDNSGPKLRRLEEKFDKKLNEADTRHNDTIDNLITKLRNTQEKIDMKLNEVASRLNDTSEKTLNELRGAEGKVDKKFIEVAVRLNDAKNKSLHELRGVEERFDMKLNEVDSRLKYTINISVSKLRNVEEKVYIKLNEAAIRLNDTKNESLHELRVLNEKFDGKLSEVFSILNDTTHSMTNKFRDLGENFYMKLYDVGSRINDTIDNSMSSIQSAEEKYYIKVNEVDARLNDTSEKTLNELRAMKVTVDKKLREVESRLTKTVDNSISTFRSAEAKVGIKLNEVAARLNDTINETLCELRDLEKNFEMKLSAVGARLNNTDNSISSLRRILLVESCAQTPFSGVYTLTSGNRVYCSNGWMVFQRRKDGSISDFHTKTWQQYSQGFGDMHGEFWLGLRELYEITRQGGCRLRVDLQSFDNDTAYAEYSTFSVASEVNLFRLNVRGYSGTAGDSMSYHNGMRFSTRERDNDRASYNCAKGFHTGGWWNNQCFHAAPNGVYGETRPGSHATEWYSFKKRAAMKFIEMGVRCD